MIEWILVGFLAGYLANSLLSWNDKKLSGIKYRAMPQERPGLKVVK